MPPSCRVHVHFLSLRLIRSGWLRARGFLTNASPCGFGEAGSLWDRKREFEGRSSHGPKSPSGEPLSRAPMHRYLCKIVRAGIIGAALLSAHPEVSLAQGRSILAFDIPAQPLSAAVLRFSEEARVQLVFGGPLADGIRANAVEGRYSIADALDRLLDGTGLTWRYLNAHTVTIESKPATTATIRN